MIRKFALICFCPLASLVAMLGPGKAQFAPPPETHQQAETAPALPDDVRLILMIRNAVLALNQANITGNYTVLREMGTPAFQMSNTSARLAEVFSGLRSRKIDLSPVMLFNPKLATPPALQDGQVLRLTGFFPTAPEQVQFDLAFQRVADRWMVAGLAINVAPAGEGAQALGAPSGQPAQTAADNGAPAKAGEAKPIRIDLSQPAPAAGKPHAPKKPAAVKRPKPASPKSAAAQAPAPDQPAQAPAPVQAEPAAPAAEKPQDKNSGFGAGWNPFGH